MMMQTHVVLDGNDYTINFERRKRSRRYVRSVLKAVREHDLVFPSADGTPISVKNLNRRAFKRACALAGLNASDFSLYSLRHTGITLSLAAGANIKAVSRKAGHSNVKTTLEIYSHVIPSVAREATDKLAAMLYSEAA